MTIALHTIERHPREQRRDGWTEDLPKRTPCDPLLMFDLFSYPTISCKTCPSTAQVLIPISSLIDAAMTLHHRGRDFLQLTRNVAQLSSALLVFGQPNQTHKHLTLAIAISSRPNYLRPTPFSSTSPPLPSFLRILIT